jgi:acetyltransferase-like isoleucine patch superfamily enzyme
VKYYLRAFKYKLIDFFEYLGFMHRHRWYINGLDARLVIEDQVIDRRNRLGYSNALFNTQSGHIFVGRNVIFGHECQVLTGRHFDCYRDPHKFKQTIESGFDIHIEDGVWLTSRVIVTGGVTIGQNTTVLPGSVVTKDMPANCVVGGMPAKVIRVKSLIE